MFSCGHSLKEGPKGVQGKGIFGHWELDTFVSGRGKSKGCFSAFLERKTRLYIAYKIPDRTAQSMAKAIRYLYKNFLAQAFKTATTNRGKEFACYATLKQELGLRLYFSDPYSS